MKVIEGGKSKRQDPNTEDLEASAIRAQSFARKAIIQFLLSEGKMKPEGNGYITTIAMQAGFLISIIEAGLISLRGSSSKYDKEYFVNLAGSVFDDVLANSEEDDE